MYAHHQGLTCFNIPMYDDAEVDTRSAKLHQYKMSNWPDFDRFGADLASKCTNATIAGVKSLKTLEWGQHVSRPFSGLKHIAKHSLAAFVDIPDEIIRTPEEEASPYIRRYVKTTVVTPSPPPRPPTRRSSLFHSPGLPQLLLRSQITTTTEGGILLSSDEEEDNCGGETPCSPNHGEDSISSNNVSTTSPYSKAEAAVDEKSGIWWIPVTTVDWTLRAGIMVCGLSHLDMLKMIIGFFPQMSVACMWRCVQNRFNFGAWKETKGDNSKTYQAIVNTSLATYYKNDIGAFVYYNCTFHSDMMKGVTTFKTISIYCDHESGTVLRMVLVPADVTSTPLSTTNNNKAASSSSLFSNSITSAPSNTNITTTTTAGAGVLFITDADEISVIVTQIGAVYSHPHIHWWANGVKEVSQWSLHETSSRWVQFLNHLAYFQSLFFYHASFENNSKVLTSNLLEGMPAHSHIPEEVLKWSITHRMAAEARVQIRAHFEAVGTPIDDSELNSLLCATLYHSADHHYTDKYLACSGISETLKTDFRVMRLCLVAGYRWIGFKFLCKQYCEEDAVCKILYEIAMKHDPELAEGILTIGISI